MKEEFEYELMLGMDHSQLRCFYLTMDRSYNNWSGGEPYEQMVLKSLRDQSWKLLLESQFQG